MNQGGQTVPVQVAYTLVHLRTLGKQRGERIVLGAKLAYESAPFRSGAGRPGQRGKSRRSNSALIYRVDLEYTVLLEYPSSCGTGYAKQSAQTS